MAGQLSRVKPASISLRCSLTWDLMFKESEGNAPRPSSDWISVHPDLLEPGLCWATRSSRNSGGSTRAMHSSNC